MLFYKIEMIVLKDEDLFEEPRSKRIGRLSAERELGTAICAVCEEINEKIIDRGYLFLSTVSHERFNFGLILREAMDVDELVEKIIKMGRLEESHTEIREITLWDFRRVLNLAEHEEYITDEEAVLKEFELEDLVNRRRLEFDFAERIVPKCSKDGIYLASNKYYAKESLSPELDRIYFGMPKKKVYGHPVHYMIESDDERIQNGITHLLVQSLNDVGRINSRRISKIELSPRYYCSKGILEALYKSCTGGTLVVRFFGQIDDAVDQMDGGLAYLEDVCNCFRRHCCDVLTIFQLPLECTSLRMKIYEYIGDCSFVEVKQEQMEDEVAISYLKDRAKQRGLRADKNLIERVEDGHMYLTPELDVIFDEWYSRKLKTTVYKQYKDISEPKKLLLERKPKGTAYEELESMIGLDSAKKMIQQAIDSYKAQKMFKDKGLSVDTFCNHMIFTGNPGTAKTSVARLFARILRDNDVISKGQIVEVGRSDLVGKYIGWTAPTVKKKFKEALGGILFIDEAYSLVDDRDGSYGDEAINTIVQEMENYRDEVIVIFAGYPDKMEEFLDKNPGLRSRIAHFIHFEDYNEVELCQIATHIASQKGMVIEDEAMEKIKGIMETAKEQSDFGNGRYVRNVIEKARMAQSSRLVHMDFDSISQDDIKTIRAEDIEIPMQTKRKVNRIGFAG